MHKKLLAALLVTTIASHANADARLNTAPVIPTFYGGLQFAQSSIDAMSASDLRRLVFYTERTIGSLTEIIEAAESGSFDELGRLIESLRGNISRLSDAGNRSGIPRDEITEFFIQAVLDGHGDGFLESVSSAAGGLDIPTLFRNVETVSASRSTTLTNNDQFLSALEDASEGLSLSETQGQVQVVEAGEPTAGPVARANATANERAVIDRIAAKTDGWEITVVSGDSLALIASALYGDSLSYNIIFQANQNILSNPNSLNIGDKLKLPMP